MCLFGNIVQAQFITLSDTNFRNQLILKYPSCFNAAKDLDTICAQNTTDSSLLFIYNAMQNIDGIHYFSALKDIQLYGCSTLTTLPDLPSINALQIYNSGVTTLQNLPNSIKTIVTSGTPISSINAWPTSVESIDMYYSSLASIPALPSGLIYLVISNANLSSLPTLPSGLEQLDVSYNSITNLPTLPNSLLSLKADHNQLNSIPALPNSLLFLSCFYNYSPTILPSSLPTSLQYLGCGGNSISALPALPTSLYTLNCAYNSLTSLPSLPGGLTDLNAQNNQLQSLPFLPTSLGNLKINNNQISSLPLLPNGLLSLIASNNTLTSLPSLPNSLYHLYVDSNTLLNCLPLLPSSLNYLSAQNTGVSCLPNFVPFLGTATPYTICANGSACEPDPTISGQVYQDLNANNSYDLGVDNDLSNWVINGTNGWNGLSNTNGQYQTKVDSGVANTVTLNPLIPYCTITPNTYTVTPTSMGSIGSTFNYQVSFIPNITDAKISVANGPARPGFQQWIAVNAINNGTLPITNATVKITRPAAFTLISSTPSISSQNGDTLIWNNVNLDMFNQQSFGLSLQIPISTTLGTAYTLNAWIEPSVADSTPVDNFYAIADTVTGSYDPNDKKVNKQQLNFATLANEELVYTIRFQNTGTDTAFTVVVRDTLSDNLDRGTFKMLGASHNYSYTIREKGLLEVFFTNIQLPDSNVNEPLSHGYFQYSIKPKPGLVIGNDIKNTAYIYFDFNSPIVTNTTSSIVTPLSINNYHTISANVYPNPTSDKLFVECEIANAEVTLTDITGKILYQSTMNKKHQIDMSNFTDGIYLCTVKNGNATRSFKVKLVR
jgi:uncharacterized repeat protein (TIGR01451 family)